MKIKLLTASRLDGGRIPNPDDHYDSYLPVFLIAQCEPPMQPITPLSIVRMSQFSWPEICCLLALAAIATQMSIIMPHACDLQWELRMHTCVIVPIMGPT